MIEVLAIAIPSLLAWDFGRRWVAREHDASEIALEARVAGYAAEVTSKANGSGLQDQATELSNLKSELAKLEDRWKATESSVRMARDARAAATPKPVAHRPLTGARRA